MLKMRLPNGQEWVIENPFDQVFSTETDDGTQYHWNVTKALRIARERGIVHIVSLAQMGVTIERIREQYDDMNEMYALTTDLASPILFVPLEGKDKLADGWHRLFHAAVLGGGRVARLYPHAGRSGQLPHLQVAAGAWN